MNHEFYDKMLNDGVLDNDEDQFIWIDWRDEEESIIDAIRSYIKCEHLELNVTETNSDSGYVVSISFQQKSLTIDPSDDFDSRHATLNALDELLPDYQIRFVRITNGSDTIAVAIEKQSDWQLLYNKYGRMVNSHFCPIRELPDLLNSTPDEIDDAADEYVDRIG